MNVLSKDVDELKIFVHNRFLINVTGCFNLNFVMWYFMMADEYCSTRTLCGFEKF